MISLKVDEKTYAAMPAHIQALFRKLPNPGAEEVLGMFPADRPGMSTQTDRKTTASNYFGAHKHPGVRVGRGDSGSAARFEKEAEYVEIAKRRIASDAPLFAEVGT